MTGLSRTHQRRALLAPNATRAFTASRRRSSGVSLMEVTIALTILGFGLLAGASAQLSAMRMSSDSRSRTEAQYLAQQQMEIIQSMSSDDVIALKADPNYPDDPDNPIDPDPGDDDSTVFDRRWIITQDDPEAGSLGIRIEVDYTNSLGLTRTSVLRSLKAEL